VAYLGRLSKEKGIDDVLEAARILPKVEFTIAGNGPLAAKVIEAQRKLPNVNYTGFLDAREARELVGRSLACVMPSTWEEPGPLSCLEAMSSGTPVVCYPNGGMAEYVLNSGAGVVCRRSEAPLLARAIADACFDQEIWEKYSNGAVAGIAERHSRDGYLVALEAVYRSAIGSGG
jgi:glycosyltransferase involved in cell wall biosynthesis